MGAIITLDNDTKIVSLVSGAKLLLDSTFLTNGNYVFLPPEITPAKTFTVTVEVTRPTPYKSINAQTTFTIVENNPGAQLTVTELKDDRFKIKGDVTETTGNYEDVVRLQHWFNYNGYRDANGNKISQGVFDYQENGIADKRYQS